MDSEAQVKTEHEAVGNAVFRRSKPKNQQEKRSKFIEQKKSCLQNIFTEQNAKKALKMNR